MNSSKKLLAISYYFPPMGTVAFLRNWHIIKYLSEDFDRTDVITIKNVSLPLGNDIYTDFANVHRIFNFDYRNLSNLISGKNNNIRNAANSKSTSTVVKLFRKSLDSFPTNLIYGEGGFLYITLAILEGIKLIKQKKITHIFSSYRPIADHVVAYNLKLIFPKLVWIADYRDFPIYQNGDNVYLKNHQLAFHRKVISKADVVTTVSDGLKSQFESLGRNDVLAMRNGVYRLFNSDKIEKYDKFTICYTGSLYTDRNVKIFFEVLLAIIEKDNIEKNIQIIYAGKDKLIWEKWISEYNLDKISVVKGEVSLAQAVQIQQKSHVNLLLTWAKENEKGILTGKFYEYLASGNPILTLINGVKDEEIENIMDKLRVGHVIYNEEYERLLKILRSLFYQWKNNGFIDFSPNYEMLSEYDWKSRIEILKKMI